MTNGKQLKYDIDTVIKPYVIIEGNPTEITKITELSTGQPSKGALDAQNGATTNGKEKVEQERTEIMKRLFLEHFVNYRVIEVVCKKLGLNSSTVRKWRKADTDFAAAMIEVEINRVDDAVDVLMGKVFVEHDGPCVRYFLDRKNPDFKPHTVTEIITGSKSMKKIIDEDAEELNKKDDANNQQSNMANEHGNNRGAPADQKQEGTNGEVQIEHSAELLLEKKNETKPNTESPAKRVK